MAIEAQVKTVRSAILPFNTRTSSRTWTPASFGITDPPIYAPAKVGNHLQTATVCWVYRFYDADQVLLYVGVTTNPTNRWQVHAGRAWWQRVRFASIEAVPPRERLAHERNAIKREKPLYNRVHSELPASTSIRINQGPRLIVDQLRARLPEQMFTELVAAFQALPSTREITS